MSNKILCPTRGGQASYPNQDRAIRLAKERNAELVFLYVSNVHFMDHLAGPKLIDIETELDEMGEFITFMAVERANAAGVEAEGIVKHENFRQVLLDVIEQGGIDTIVFGESRLETTSMPPNYIQNLAKELNETTSVEVIIVDDGGIVNQVADKEQSSE
jgi:nucleotide-binding universal stress UspA family protein